VTGLGPPERNSERLQAEQVDDPATAVQRTADFTPKPVADPPTVPALEAQPTSDSTPGTSAGTSSVPASPDVAPAAPAAFGRYQVRRALGEGGFGAVYLGHDTQPDRPVAIKVLRAESGQAQAEGERCLQEARRLARLNHAGIVTVHDVGVHEGQVYDPGVG